MNSFSGLQSEYKLTSTVKVQEYTIFVKLLMEDL